MAEGSANKAKISDRDKKLLFIVAGIVVLALAYFLGFQKMMETKNTLVEENIQLEQEVQKLMGMVAKKAQVEEETQQCRTDVEKILVNYPLELRTQDAIYQLDLMEQAVKGLELKTESFTMNQPFFANGALIDSAVQDVTETTSDTAGTGNAMLAGYCSDVTATCETDYKSLKQIIEFINSSTNRMTIETIAATRGEGKKELTCSIGINMYSVTGTEKEYRDPNVTSSQVGKEDLFSRN